MRRKRASAERHSVAPARWACLTLLTLSDDKVILYPLPFPPIKFGEVFKAARRRFANPSRFL